MGMSMLSMAKRLRDAGFTDVQVEALGELVEQTFATKDDLAQHHKDLSGQIEQVRKDLSAEIEQVRRDLSAEIALVRKDLSTEIEQVRKDMAAEIALVRAEIALVRKDLSTEIALVRKDMDALAQTLTIRLGAMMCLAIGVVATLVKLL